ncbi:hypothetical protein SALBM311S_02914 [Streptomyces alboniger]
MLHTPSGGTGHGTAAADSGLMSIGTVLNVLRDEFPEVTISKIRFLESEGLIEPQRTPSGYRKFTVADVERLGHVLRMQRDHYLPLKVIRDHLDAMERGEAVQLPVLGRQRDGEAVPDVFEGPTAARIGRAELLAAAQIGEGEGGSGPAWGRRKSPGVGGPKHRGEKRGGRGGCGGGPPRKAEPKGRRGGPPPKGCDEAGGAARGRRRPARGRAARREKKPATQKRDRPGG